MTENTKTKKEKRYQELGTPYRIYLWLRWMPLGYAKAFGWYFVKRLKWEDVCDDECGRISLSTCIGICVGTVQGEMKWYYTSDEVFGEDGYAKERERGCIENVIDFLEDKLVEIVDGRSRYDYGDYDENEHE